MSEAGRGDICHHNSVPWFPPKVMSLLQHVEKSFKPAECILFCCALYLKCLSSPLLSPLKMSVSPFFLFLERCKGL